MNDSPQPVRRIYRSRGDRIIAGVCGGLAQHFKMDPVIIRILWVCGSIFLGAILGGIIAYAVCWAIIPEENVPPVV